MLGYGRAICVGWLAAGDRRWRGLGLPSFGGHVHGTTGSCGRAVAVSIGRYLLSGMRKVSLMCSSLGVIVPFVSLMQ